MNQAKLLEQLRHGSQEAIRSLYRLYRQEFVSWAMRTYACREEEAIDAFQESVVILYEKVQGSGLTELHSQLKTYLFGIGKNRLRKQFSKEVIMDTPLNEQVSTIDTMLVSHELEASDQSKNLAEIVGGMSSPCDQLLYLFYYRNFSMESIANRMEYKSADVAKTQKNRCLKRLIAIAKKRGLA